MKNPVHPGRIVRHDCLEELGLSVTEAAKALGVSRQALNNIVNGKAGISPEMAIRLTKAFGSTPETGRHSLEETKTRTVGVQRGRPGQIGEKLAQLWEELREIGGVRAELGAQRRRRRLADIGAKGLHPGPVDRSSTCLPTAPVQNTSPARPGAADQFFREPALADAGLARE